jgi:type IV secretory pathway VirB10-like protein
MTTQTAGDIDVFAPPASKPGVAQTTPEPKVTTEHPAKKQTTSFVEKVKPWHLFVLVAVVAVIWIFGPKLGRSNAPAVQSQQFTAQNTPAAYSSIERPTPAQPVQEPPSPPPVSDQIDLVQVKSEMETFAKVTSELQSQVRELQAKIAVLESRPQEPTQKPKERQERPASIKNQATATPKALAGYGINTLYADQAWLVHDQKTFVVQVGDDVDGMRVLRIDPVARQVVTNLGVIR